MGEQTLPAVLKWARSHTDEEKFTQGGLCEMQRAAAMSPWRGVAGEVGVWLDRLTWEFWIWMVPGGSACVNTCPCDVTMATGWYRVPPEGIICRLWVPSGVGCYQRQQPPPPLHPPPPPSPPPAPSITMAWALLTPSTPTNKERTANKGQEND